MNQHYLPNFYLKHFTDPDTPLGQQAYVWIYSSEEPRWRKKGTAKVASLKHFYTAVGADGGKNLTIEQIFQRIEDAAAPAILKLQLNGQPTSEDRLAIAWFVATLLIRVPVQITHLKKGFIHLHKQLIANTLQLFDAESGGALRVADLMSVADKKVDSTPLLDPQNYEVTVSLNTILIPQLAIAEKVVEWLIQMEWIFVSTESPNCFITTDSPAYLSNRNCDGLIGGGFASLDAELSCPLTKDIALLTHWRDKSSEAHWLPGTPEDVQMINMRSLIGARHLVVASNTDFPGRELAEQYMSAFGEAKTLYPGLGYPQSVVRR